MFVSGVRLHVSRPEEMLSLKRLAASLEIIGSLCMWYESKEIKVRMRAFKES